LAAVFGAVSFVLLRLRVGRGVNSEIWLVAVGFGTVWAAAGWITAVAVEGVAAEFSSDLLIAI
jgi:hypothetical protein